MQSKGGEYQMGKQPYIPLYIGDWEQDTNCLSLEAEGAWLKLVFKLWKGESDLGKGLLSISFRAMSVLFKSSPEKTKEIFKELIENKIFDHEILPNGDVKIKSRRMVRDAELSKIRSEVGKKGGRPTEKQTVTKNKPKQKQNTDIEYDIEVENDIETLLKESLGKIYLEHQKPKWPNVDFEMEVTGFFEKVRGSPDKYIGRDIGSIREAFIYQLRHAKKNGIITSKTKQHPAIALAESVKSRYRSQATGTD